MSHFFSKIKKTINSLSSSFEYYVLFKKTSFSPFDDDFLYGFSKIKTTYSCWVADPFIFEHNHNNYIFAELGNRISWHGKIGYYCLEKHKEKWHTCIKEKWHLSFPNVFIWDNNIVMMCESYECGCIYFYKCIEFPNKWIKMKEHIVDGVFVDSEAFTYENKKYLITYSIKNNENILFIFEYKNNKFVELQRIKDESAQLRPAGKIFYVDNKLFLPTQDCSQTYGYGIIINELIFCNNLFQIKRRLNLSIENFEKIYRTKTLHFHTLNHNNEYVVIDAASSCNSSYVFYKRFLYYLCKKLRGENNKK